ncbi:MAG: cyclic nucleotide-binding domain-containing protein [Lentisphaeraceae bacterium]|nr:cyclic nucleotide-binding domain-containing protein [Lentisphaeraceae bacterium]
MTLKEKITNILPQISLLGGLPEKDIEIIIDIFSEKKFSKGDVLIHEDTPPDYCYILLSGEIEISLNNKELLIIDDAGAIFGLAGPIGIQNDLFTITALADLETLRISTAELCKLSQSSPEIFGMLMFNIARDLARGLKMSKEVISTLTKV